MMFKQLKREYIDLYVGCYSHCQVTLAYWQEGMRLQFVGLFPHVKVPPNSDDSGQMFSEPLTKNGIGTLLLCKSVQ